MKSIPKDTSSDSQTKSVAEKFALDLKGGEVICLYGDLGYGKTTFVQGLARGLRITGKIISPTFIIMRSYTTGIKNFYHVDLYRINHEQEIIDLGLMDIMGDSDNIVAIEWPEKMGKLLPEKRTDVKFEYIDAEKRVISIVNTVNIVNPSV